MLTVEEAEPRTLKIRIFVLDPSAPEEVRQVSRHWV